MTGLTSKDQPEAAQPRYQIDLERYSLGVFKGNLRDMQLIPSRASLKDSLDERFGILEAAGIGDLKALVEALKTKAKIAAFSQETGLPVEYLTLLKREASSYVAKPVRLDKFEGIAKEHLERLEAAGINNSRGLFTTASRAAERVELSRRTGVPTAVLDELVCLSDLARAYGVGPAFARMLYDLGIKTIGAFVSTTAEEVIRLYERETGKKADFGVNEINFSLALARELDIAVEI
jgi:nucleotidyltransferase/DNA polymerase involved in DNA repair